MRTAFLRPAVVDGAPLKIRMPDEPTRHLSEDGELVALNGYWRNRLRDGDVLKGEAPKTKSAPPAASSKPAAKKEG